MVDFFYRTDQSFFSPAMEPPVLPTHRRYHDFDALRSGAMLLGIVLHGMMSLVPLPLAVWPAQDVSQSPFYLFLLHAIHGFRMQLFFVLSGFILGLPFVIVIFDVNEGLIFEPSIAALAFTSSFTIFPSLNAPASVNPIMLLF